MGDRWEARILGEDRYPAWNTFVAEAPGGSPYADTRYLDLLSRWAGGRFQVVAVFKGDELVGGLPLYERRSATGRYVAPRLLLYYNGFVLRARRSQYPSRAAREERRALACLEEALQDLGHAQVVLRSRSQVTDLRILQANGWALQPGYTYEVPITDLDGAWSRMEQNLRRQVKRARNEGVEVTEDDDFEAFYQLHVHVHQRKGAPLYLPRNAYRQYVHGLLAHDLARLFHARLPDGRVVSTQLVLTSQHPVTHTVCAAAQDVQASSGATALLRWEALRRLSKAGYAATDLTDAALNPVTRFKEQLGGDLRLSLAASRRTSPAFRVEAGLRTGVHRTRAVARAAARRGAGWLGNGRGSNTGERP